MHQRATWAGVSTLLAAALLALGCGDTVGPARRGLGAPTFSHTGSSGIAFDQKNGSLGEFGTTLIKGFGPTNPHRGSAVVVTFFWIGSTNIITDVTDLLGDGTAVGNTYVLVEYVTANGLSMATYVATNVQGFPDPNPTPETVLVVRATLSLPVADGGVMLSAYTGVTPGLTEALGEHRSAAGSSDTHTIASPGPIAVAAGALAYGVTLTDGRVGFAPPEGFTNLSTMSDVVLQTDAVYAVRDSAGSVNPQWTWFFEPPLPRTWLATVLALNPAPTPTGAL